MNFPSVTVSGEPAMSHRLLTATLLAALLGLAGCGGNYKSSDDDYRPLGDPHAEQQRDD